MGVERVSSDTLDMDHIEFGTCYLMAHCTSVEKHDTIKHREITGISLVIDKISIYRKTDI